MDFLPLGKKRKLALLNVIYNKGNRDNDYKDSISVVYRDTETGFKDVKHIENPKIDVYFTKDDFCNYKHNKQFEYLDRCDKVEMSYKNLVYGIAKDAGGPWLKYVNDKKNERQYRAMKNIHKYPYVFGSDMDIENLYRAYWNIEYGTEHIPQLTKGYLDIEVDGINIPGFPKPGECPINAITIIDSSSMISHTFLLRNEKNPQIDEFENNIADFRLKLAEAFNDTYGEFEYKFYMYDEKDEHKLIIDTFKLINTIDLDFISIWNMGFDIPYITERIKELGYDPEEVMCGRDFPVKSAFYWKDANNFKVENKGDYFKISSKTYFVDQMILYAALRKGGSELRSNKLNYIGKVEVGDEKLDYSEIADIKTLPYVDFEKFVMYNIKDEKNASHISVMVYEKPF